MVERGRNHFAEGLTPTPPAPKGLDVLLSVVGSPGRARTGDTVTWSDFYFQMISGGQWNAGVRAEEGEQCRSSCHLAGWVLAVQLALLTSLLACMPSLGMEAEGKASSLIPPEPSCRGWRTGLLLLAVHPPASGR